MGALTLINSVFGCIGSCYKRSMLTIYLIIGTILTLAQVLPAPSLDVRTRKRAKYVLSSSASHCSSLASSLATAIGFVSSFSFGSSFFWVCAVISEQM